MGTVTLIAEDEPDDALLLSLALEKAGIRGPVFRVDDGTEVLQYLEGNGPFADRKQWPYPDLLLLDLKMPRVTGFEVLERLRREGGFSCPPTVVITGLERPHDIARVQELGARFCILKSAKPDELTAALLCVADALLTVHGWAAPTGSPSPVAVPPPNLLCFPPMVTCALALRGGGTPPLQNPMA